MNKLLEQTQAVQTTERDSTEGRFFMPEGNRRRQRTDTMMAKLDSMLDLANSGDLVREIRETVAVLGLNKRTYSIDRHIEVSLVEAIDELNKLMTEHNGLCIFTLDQNLKSCNSQKISLFEDYGVAADDCTGTMILVPSTEITGIQILPNLASATKYEPVMNIRIKTSDNQPITHFGEAGELVQEESPGRWYRLPVATTSVDLLQ